MKRSIFPLFVLLFSSAAVAEEPLKLQLSGWAQAGYVASEPPGVSFGHDFYLGLARLGARATYNDWGGAYIQVGDRGGTVSVLDAIAELRPAKPVLIRMGRFKVPTSMDYLISASATSFVNRSLVTDMVQKRLLGAEIHGTIGDGPQNAKVQIGWFLPPPSVQITLPESTGSFISARTLVNLSDDLALHLAFLTLAFTDRSLLSDPRPVPYDRQLDFAVNFTPNNWTILFETLINLEGPQEDSELTYGAYLQVLNNIPLKNSEFSIEPGVRYDIQKSQDGDPDHRVTLGTTWYLFGDYLNASTNYEMMVLQEQVGHAFYLQLQAGFKKTFEDPPPAPAESDAT